MSSTGKLSGHQIQESIHILLLPKNNQYLKRRQNEDTASFRNVYRYRAGIEATMSQFDRLTGVKHLRVRGLKAVSCAATLKALGLNILRSARFVYDKKSGFCGIRKAGVSIIAVHIDILRFILKIKS